MPKLIRDKLENVIDSERLTTAQSSSEMFILLRAKISEELAELAETAFNDVDEYGDVIEVLYAMANFQGITKDQIEIARLKKLDERGAFNKCLILKD